MKSWISFLVLLTVAVLAPACLNEVSVNSFKGILLFLFYLGSGFMLSVIIAAFVVILVFQALANISRNWALNIETQFVVMLLLIIVGQTILYSQGTKALAVFWLVSRF